MEDEVRKTVLAFIQVSCNMLVDAGDVITVSQIVGDRTTVFRIQTSDVGAVLGKKGRLIGAIRAIAYAFGHKHGIRIYIEIDSEPVFVF